MGRNRLWILSGILFVVLIIVVVAAALNRNPNENKEANSIDKHEHVFGTLTPTTVPSPGTPDVPVGSLGQDDPGEPTLGAGDIPDDGLEIIDQESLGLTSDIDYLKAKTETGHVIEIIDGLTFVDGFLIANKTYALPSDFIPPDPNNSLEGVEYSFDTFDATTWKAWEELQKAADAEGLYLYIGSGYRSYSCQKDLYNNYVARDGKAAADTYSARAGHSEHQTGLCFDLNSVTDAFANTAEGKWVHDNCWKYGLILRYPKGKDDITGYKYESWHLRYVGKELAEKLYNNGDWITMEEYFGLTSRYAE